MATSSSYPYRPSTLAIVTDTQGRYLLVQTNQYQDNEWNFPGGGIDPGETPQQAIQRELHEELGTDKLTFQKQFPQPIQYDWPQSHVELYHSKTGQWYRGQTKHIFHYFFSGTDADIHLQISELRTYKWVTTDQLPQHLIFPSQLAAITPYLPY